MDNDEILQARDQALERLHKIYGDDAETIIADRRYAFIDGLLDGVLKRPAAEKLTWSDRIDRVIVNRWLGIPIFLAIMYGVFQFTFTLSAPLMDWIGAGFDFIAAKAMGISPEWLGSLLGNGIIGGVGTVLTFIPPIFLLFIAIAILEDSGYMARAAFVMDRVMHKIGLHGRSFIPMVLGFGCNIPAIMATRTIENPKDRLITILVNPLMSCGARLPIYILLAGAFFPAYRGLVVFSMYLIGIILAIIMAKIFRKWLLPGPVGHFVMELPPYRLPTVVGVTVHMWERGKHFLIKAGTIIVGVVVLVWLLSSMPWGVQYAGPNSWVGQLGRFIAPIFKPCGFGQWQAAVSLFFGFLAKETVVGTMGAIFAVKEGSLGTAIATQLGWTPLVAFAFMVFALLYTPCVAAIATIKAETGSWKWPAFTIGYELALAWIMATLIYQIGRLFI